ncbi:MAG: DUF501 domain-containing protein [Actinobacteria bacterium]|nr:DUF501 domain-containing protein [Actinomycetota bacterium]
MRLLVARQLGRMPDIGFEVAVTCSYGWPAVLRNLTRTALGRPNPNLYYLSCPWLRRGLARLEDSGLIDELQQKLTSNRDLYLGLMRAQKLYSDEYRRAVAAAAAKSTGESTADEDGVLIAASRRPELLKCLHAHAAFYLIHDDYLLGRKIMSALTATECSDERCAGWAMKIMEEDQPDDGKKPSSSEKRKRSSDKGDEPS